MKDWVLKIGVIVVLCQNKISDRQLLFRPCDYIPTVHVPFSSAFSAVQLLQLINYVFCSNSLVLAREGRRTDPKSSQGRVQRNANPQLVFGLHSLWRASRSFSDCMALSPHRPSLLVRVGDVCTARGSRNETDYEFVGG